jgi:hypothetical protein
MIVRGLNFVYNLVNFASFFLVLVIFDNVPNIIFIES